MRFVPVVALVPEHVARRIEDLAAAPEAVQVLEGLGDLADRNGWTAEMVVAGAALRTGLG